MSRLLVANAVLNDSVRAFLLSRRLDAVLYFDSARSARSARYECSPSRRDDPVFDFGCDAVWREELCGSGGVCRRSRGGAVRDRRTAVRSAKPRHVPAARSNRIGQGLYGLHDGVAGRIRAWGVVAVDGKSLRRGYEKGRSHMPPLMVSVWDSQTRVAIAQARAPGGNEVAATLQLLRNLVLKSCTVTADALHCHPA